MFAYYIILVYASQFIQMFDKFASFDSVIGIVYRFYVNPDSKYLHVRFVICACSIICLHITCLNYNSI